MANPRGRVPKLRKETVLIVVICLLAVVVICVWMLSQMGVIPPVVAGGMTIGCTVASIVFPILQSVWGSSNRQLADAVALPVTSVSAPLLPVSLPIEPDRASHPFVPLPSVEDLKIVVSHGRAVVVVWLSKKSPYSTLYLSHGHDNQLLHHVIANVDEHGEHYKVAIFPSVTPGPYTLFAENGRKPRHIMAQKDQIIKVNWTKTR